MEAKVLKTPTIIELLKVIGKTKFKSHLAPQCGATPPLLFGPNAMGSKFCQDVNCTDS
jgi:hypothetical protein